MHYGLIAFGNQVIRNAAEVCSSGKLESRVFMRHSRFIECVSKTDAL